MHIKRCVRKRSTRNTENEMDATTPLQAGREIAAIKPMPAPAALRDELLNASPVIANNLRRTDLSVPSIRCGGCIQNIERAIGELPGVERARVNLSTKRVSVVWHADGTTPPLMETLTALGHDVHLDQPEQDATDKTHSEHIKALAVAGFASGNIMMLSVAVWSGADAISRDLFHAVSALIALPTLVYSGRVFFRSAFAALRHGHTNMDVPISLGVILAFVLSLYETVNQGEQAYFEASVMLLFFLLIGRTLDHMMREKARRAVTGLAKLVPRTVNMIFPDGRSETLPLSGVEPGMFVLVAVGERVPVDGRIIEGVSDVDRALVTGESEPQSVQAGSVVQAGTLNLTGPLIIQASVTEKDSFLAQMIRLMETVETKRPPSQRIADRVSQFYAPVVHGAALASFAGWMIAVGDVHQAITVAVAVLIVTCPCALGLAVPMVQVVAARRLFEHGIVIKDGAALERLREIDTVVFDKTGTLTMGAPVLQNLEAVAPESLALAAAMGAQSHHPLSRALAASSPGAYASPLLTQVIEHPGCGVEAMSGHDTIRLGRAEWALDGTSGQIEHTDYTETVLSKNGKRLEVFRFEDPLRPGVRDAIKTLQGYGLSIHLLSGDRAQPVRLLAHELGLKAFKAEAQPTDKVTYLEALAAHGHKVLMVGDGLNDAPALCAAHVSAAPGSAADVGRNAAGLVFLGDSLGAIPFAFEQSRKAGRLVRQNFVLAAVYNAVALPFAVFGFITPLIAAVAMSLSSITVVANALRLNAGHGKVRTSGERANALQRTALVSKPAE